MKLSKCVITLFIALFLLSQLQKRDIKERFNGLRRNYYCTQDNYHPFSSKCLTLFRGLHRFRNNVQPIGTAHNEIYNEVHPLYYFYDASNREHRYYVRDRRHYYSGDRTFNIIGTRKLKEGDNVIIRGKERDGKYVIKLYYDDKIYKDDKGDKQYNYNLIPWNRVGSLRSKFLGSGRTDAFYSLWEKRLDSSQGEYRYAIRDIYGETIKLKQKNYLYEGAKVLVPEREIYGIYTVMRYTLDDLEPKGVSQYF
jgi:hypothetical protein